MSNTDDTDDAEFGDVPLDEVQFDPEHYHGFWVHPQEEYGDEFDQGFEACREALFESVEDAGGVMVLHMTESEEGNRRLHQFGAEPYESEAPEHE